jgi:heme oxygenase
MQSAAAATATDVRINPPPVGLREVLRHNTAEAHARLDARLGTLDLHGLSGYRRFLEANAAALLPLERALIKAGVARMFADWEMRSRREAILEDLACLGGAADELPAPRLDVAGVLGTMYVLEGSRLGARYLLKNAEASPDPRIAAATAYLRHGAAEHLWQSFLPKLESHGAALGDQDGVIAGAQRAFDLFAEAAARLKREAPEAVGA